jgi:hypothetical protein
MARPAGVRVIVGIRESGSKLAGLPRHDVFVGYDPDKEEREQRRELLGRATAGNLMALAELRALGLTRWERGDQVLIRNGKLVGAKRNGKEGA